MRMHSVISHGVIGCAGVIAGYVVVREQRLSG